MADFVPGLELAGAFYRDAVRPLLGGVPHSAALLGWGSEVLGFDTERSTDHGWGPRLQVFVAPDDVEAVAAAVERGLPDEFGGRPTRFGWDEHPVEHHVEVVALPDWLRAQLGFDPTGGVSRRDWLTTPQHLLLEVTAGRVFHDGLGTLEPVRAALAWYPDDVWLWLIACQWRRIDQEEPFVGRAAEVGDELGSRVVAARLVREAMRLGFLLERRYAPYSKWLGSAFRRLESGRAIGPSLERALGARDHAAREEALLEALGHLAERHNALGLTRPVDPAPRRFYGRPFLVLGSGRFVDACLERLSGSDPQSSALLGSIDQFVDSTDVLSYPERARRAGAMYERE